MSVAASVTTHLPAKIRRHLPLSRRSDGRERLDELGSDPQALAANLRDLVRMNRLPGGAAASISAIERLARGRRRLSVLDVGTGAGDLPRAFALHARRGGGRWTVVALDRRADVLQLARMAGGRDVTLVHGDAIALEVADRSVDVAHASLLLHHLEPDDAIRALREMRRVSRLGVVINDLRRGVLPFVMAAPLIVGLSRSEMTRHDGLLSLRRAYTLPELDEMLAAAGLRVVRRSSPLMPRVVTAAVPTETA